MAAVYRGLSRAQLDAQYDLRAAVADAEAHFARYRTQSAAAYDSHRHRRNLRYGHGARHTLDLFPAGEGAPGFAFIHGGYWRSFDKEAFAYLAPAFVDAGVAVALVEYTLCPQTTLAGIVSEARAALGWLHAHGGEHGLDADRIAVGGHSAGGHLTAALLTTDWPAHGLPPDVLAGGVAISGLFDLEPVRHTFLNDDLRLADEAEARAVSPLYHVPEKAPPLVLAVGGDETDEFLRQQAEFAAAWRAKGLPLTVLEQPGRHHFDVIDGLGRAGHPLHEAALALLRVR